MQEMVADLNNLGAIRRGFTASKQAVEDCKDGDLLITCELI